MTAYSYKAFTAQGRLEDGQLEAASPDEVAQILDRRGLIPVSVETGSAGRAKPTTWSFRSIAAAQVTRLLADLAIMLNAGIRIDEALSIMEREFDNGRLHVVIARMREELAGGRAFSQAMEDWPALFPPFQIAMVRVAESSGRLPMLLSRIAEERQRFERLAARVMEALRYPAVLLVGTVGVLLFFLIGVMPQFEPILATTETKDPYLKLMFGLSQSIRANGDVIMAAVAGFLLIVLLAARRASVRASVFEMVTRLPGISEIARSYRTARFSRLLGIMVETGITAPNAIRLISDTIDKGDAARARAERASDAVRQGHRFSSALEILQMPPLALRMLRIGEQSGELAALSYKVADFYEARLERSLGRLVGFLGPAAVATISLLIGGMIVSIMSTLMSFNDMVR